MARLNIEIPDHILDYIDSVVERTGQSRPEVVMNFINYSNIAASIFKQLQKDFKFDPDAYWAEHQEKTGLKVNLEVKKKAG